MRSALVLGFFVAFGCHDPRRTVDAGLSGDLAVAAEPDLSNVYGPLEGTDAGICDGGIPSAQCTATASDKCSAVELCGTDGHGNGLDDNCDGKVDDVCSCTSGAVQKCALGPPGRRGIGACTDGQQTCAGGEIAFWGPCTGGIGVHPEACDAVDNDCDGCADEDLCCDAQLICPTSVPDALPFSDVTYKGTQLFTGTGVKWSWKVSGGPCDRLFATTTGSPATQSFTVTGGDTSTPKVHFTLSGDYTVSLEVTDNDGKTWTCGFVQHVAGPGVRFELCWDTTGYHGCDLDLHVHRSGTTTDFFGSDPSTDSRDDCDYRNCKPESLNGAQAPNWGYGFSPLAACLGAPGGFVWTSLGACRNPRLDVDNVADTGVPENVNIDNPLAGDTFRALVHYFKPNLLAMASSLVSHPLVNIYCGGHLKATYGQAPDQVQGFTTGNGWMQGDMWRVADVTAVVDATGVTTDCTVTPLHPIGATAGYRIGHDNKLSYEGN